MDVITDNNWELRLSTKSYLWYHSTCSTNIFLLYDIMMFVVLYFVNKEIDEKSKPFKATITSKI